MKQEQNEADAKLDFIGTLEMRLKIDRIKLMKNTRFSKCDPEVHMVIECILCIE